jgi:hypothetical protein
MPKNMDLDDLNIPTGPDMVELEWYGILMDSIYDEEDEDDSYQFCLKTMCHAVDYVSGLLASCVVHPSLLVDHDWATSYDNNLIIFQLIHNAAMTENLIKYFEKNLKGFKFLIHYDFPNLDLEDEDADLLYFMRQMCTHPMLISSDNYQKDFNQDDDNSAERRMKMRKETDHHQNDDNDNNNNKEESKNNHEKSISKHNRQNSNESDNSSYLLRKQKGNHDEEDDEDDDDLLGSFGAILGIDLEVILKSLIDTNTEEPILSLDEISTISHRIKPIEDRIHVFASNIMKLKNLETEISHLIEIDRHLINQYNNQMGGNMKNHSNDSDNDSVKHERNSKAAKEAMFDKFDDIYANAKVKIVDFGNACWTHKHFTDDIQTRQYRSPEVIINAGYDTSADMWSLACMVFELLTGDLMFDPHAGKSWSREEDHLALMMELVGNFPKSLLVEGKLSSEYFSRNGDLRHIHNLNYWGLRDVLYEKYKFTEVDAKDIADFLEPLLEVCIPFFFFNCSFHQSFVFL